MWRVASLTHDSSASFWYFTPWCSSYRGNSPRKIASVSASDGSTTSIVWNRRESALSLLNARRNSSWVVLPMHRKEPLPSAGLSRFDASIEPPLVAPAPTSVWISSMNRIAFGLSSRALITPLSRSSKSPRYRVPASSAPMSSA
jgi:hypothetical protein